MEHCTFGKNLIITEFLNLNLKKVIVKKMESLEMLLKLKNNLK